MSSHARRRLAIVAAIALAAAARGASASPAGFPRLSSPAPRSRVSAGETAEIAVTGAPEGAEEWEAFLSLDNGVTWPLRVTPHLPIAERTFRWTVPALASGPARVKVRFGVAGVEREFVLDETFSIAGGAGPLLAPERAAIGASPAPGEEGTLAWVDGSRGVVVPFSPRALGPAPRWRSAERASVPAPRRAALPWPAPATFARPPLPAPPSAVPAPLRRSIASLSRLNV